MFEAFGAEMSPTPLERLIVEAQVLAGAPHPCALLGHKWVHVGGANCGCADEDGRLDGCCSVPVHECEACGDCDYGNNEEARERRAECRSLSERHEG